jgi:hypothetical protein
MDAVLGVIDLEHDDRGWGDVGGETGIPQHPRPAGECAAGDAVGTTRQRRR